MEVLPETVTEAKEAPPLPETVTEVIKRGRGRPKKEINVTEIREKMKRGPKTNLTADKNYFTQWYADHYKGKCMTCPSCKNPNINVAKIHRHMRSPKCLKDTTLNKYSVYGI